MLLVGCTCNCRFCVVAEKLPLLRQHLGWLQEKLLMFKEMHSVRGKYLARMHERLARELQRQRMGDADR